MFPHVTRPSVPRTGFRSKYPVTIDSARTFFDVPFLYLAFGLEFVYPSGATNKKTAMKNRTSNPYQQARKTALSLLARRQHSEAEIRHKLVGRGFDAEIIDRVVQACKRYDYIDDETAAGFFIEELIRKQVGLLRIREAMKKRGFSSNLVSRLIETHGIEDRELELAQQALEKKMPALFREQDARKRKEKTIRFLRSRGFRHATISELMRRIGTDEINQQL